MTKLSAFEVKHLIATMSPQELAVIARILMPKLIDVAEAAQSLLAEEGAREALSVYNALFILEERVHSL